MMDGVQLLTWSKDSFAYADSFDEKEARYRGLRCGQMVTISASEPTGLLVKPDIAAKQQEAERPPVNPALSRVLWVAPRYREKRPAHLLRNCRDNFTAASRLMQRELAAMQAASPTKSSRI
jgi:hypothetical protein